MEQEDLLRLRWILAVRWSGRAHCESWQGRRPHAVGSETIDKHDQQVYLIEKLSRGWLPSWIEIPTGSMKILRSNDSIARCYCSSQRCSHSSRISQAGWTLSTRSNTSDEHRCGCLEELVAEHQKCVEARGFRCSRFPFWEPLQA